MRGEYVCIFQFVKGILPVLQVLILKDETKSSGSKAGLKTVGMLSNL
jgi:hypothetical protein